MNTDSYDDHKRLRSFEKTYTFTNEKKCGSSLKRLNHKSNLFNETENEERSLNEKPVKEFLTIDEIQSLFNIRQQSQMDIFSRTKTKSQASLNELREKGMMEIEVQDQNIVALNNIPECSSVDKKDNLTEDKLFKKK